MRSQVFTSPSVSIVTRTLSFLEISKDRIPVGSSWRGALCTAVGFVEKQESSQILMTPFSDTEMREGEQWIKVMQRLCPSRTLTGRAFGSARSQTNISELQS